MARLLVDGSAEAQRDLAASLAEATDRLVRERLAAGGASLLPVRPGRRTVPDAWVRSLGSADPWLSPSLAPDRVRALVDEVRGWVGTGAAVPGSVRVCLRVVEPEADPEPDPDPGWGLEVVAQDLVDTAIVTPLAELFSGSAMFGPEALEEALTVLGRAVRLAPELTPLVEQARPDRMSFDSDGLIAFVRDRLGPLADLGVAVWLPHWWTTDGRLGLRAKATSRSASEPSVTEAGFGLDELVSFSWVAALGDEELSEADLADLARAATAKEHLVRFRGRWIQIDPGQVEALLERVGRHQETTAGALLRAGLGLDDLGADAAGLDVVGVDADGWVGHLLDEAITRSVEPVAAPPGFAGQLRPYQQRGVGWLTFLGRLGLGGCLADDMGLGKTAQLIGAVLADTAGGPTLVVSPVSVLGNWCREIERFAPGLTVRVHHGPDRIREDPAAFAAQAADHDIVLTSYGLLQRDREQLEAVAWGRVVLDEAQQIKNPGTRVARAARALAAGRRVALTGTPVENRLSELWSIMQFLNPGLLGSAASFRETFARPIEADHDEEVTAHLARVTTPFVLRRLKSDRSIITDLPNKIETVDACHLTREQVSLYQSVVEELLQRAAETDGMQRRGLVLAGISRLKQVGNHPAHFLGDGSGLAGRSGKLARTEELLEEIVSVGDKTLVFTQFTAWGDRLAPYLAARLGVECWWLHGGVNRAGRDGMVAAFTGHDGPAVLLLSVKAGGTGLNLTEASHVIHYDRWWNPAVEDQATDRAYRIGQDRTVQVHKLVSARTIEERIDEMIAGKRQLAERVVGTGEDWLTGLSTDELAEAVALAPGAAA
ncbi:MAG: SNF2-related protein [Acidimicrobiales bacterium]